jgi:Ca2+-binding EF-hand superfamily protein
MNKCGVRIFLMIFVCALFLLTGKVLRAQNGGIPTEAIKNAYQQILAGADKNGDGTISTQECTAMSASRDMGKNCKYWDANGDGAITEDEYVQQVKKMGNRN